MAMKWDPRSSPVGKNELVGRRLFDEPMLKGAVSQRTFGGVLLTHFEEKRDKELSLDRLGPSGGIVKSIKSYLIQRAKNAGATFKPARKFNGWFVVSAKFLETGYNGKTFRVIASPQEGSDLEENLYHAHAEIPEEMDHKVAAFYLREIFVKNGVIEQYKETEEGRMSSTNEGADHSESKLQNWFKRILNWFNREHQE